MFRNFSLLEIFNMNKKQTSKSISSMASGVLRNPNASQVQKTLAGSALAQSQTDKQTSDRVETIASKVLNSNRYANETKSLAGTVLAQSDE